MVDKELFADSAWFIAIGASKFVSAPIAEIDTVDWSRLLEIRVFDERHEIKLVRGSLNEEFQVRDSVNIAYDKQRFETQYLDIDSKKTQGGLVWAIGGGEYRLPEPLPEMLELEHFYKADKTGFYYPFDFRIVRFLYKAGSKGEQA